LVVTILECFAACANVDCHKRRLFVPPKWVRSPPDCFKQASGLRTAKSATAAAPPDVRKRSALLSNLIETNGLRPKHWA